MTEYSALPLPTLQKRTVESITMYTDDALASSVGVYMGFSERSGGVSAPPYDSLNLAGHVEDNPASVLENRRILLETLGFPDVPVIVPNQVHGIEVLDIARTETAYLESIQMRVEQGADALVLSTTQVAALLCFADCAPVIVVSPTGRTGVVHAGWRGAYAGILGKTLRDIVRQDACVLHVAPEEVASQINVYIGPYIHTECFEVKEEVASRFAKEYGKEVVAVRDGNFHVDLGAVLRVDAARAGIAAQRIADLNVCTVCSTDRFFSFRASGGICGRHGAFAVRREVL